MLLLHVLGVFSMLSLLAIGGGAAVLPEMKSWTVGAAPWITDAQFGQIYSLGQLAPGPNMLMVAVIGYHVASWAGAAMALLGFFVPSGLLAFAAGQAWDRFAANPWREAVARGLGPMTIGLILAGAISIERAVMQGGGPLPYAIAAAVIAILATTRVNPFFLIAGGGLATWLARQAGIL